jgi:hypothetical protein
MVAVSLRTELTVPTDQEAGWAAESVWMLWRRENLFPWLGIDSQFFVFPACNICTD